MVTFTYYGLSLNATSLAGDPYLNFFLVSLIEAPGYALSYVTMEKLGRRFSVSSSFLLGGVCLLVDPFVSPSLGWLKTLLFLLGKMGATCAFG